MEFRHQRLHQERPPVGIMPLHSDYGAADLSGVADEEAGRAIRSWHLFPPGVLQDWPLGVVCNALKEPNLAFCPSRIPTEPVVRDESVTDANRVVSRNTCRVEPEVTNFSVPVPLLTVSPVTSGVYVPPTFFQIVAWKPVPV